MLKLPLRDRRGPGTIILGAYESPGLKVMAGEFKCVDLPTAFDVAADVATVLGVSVSLGAAASRVIKKST